MRRAAAFAIAAVLGLAILLSARPAWASDVKTTLIATPSSTKVDGKPVAIRIQLLDANGKPVPDATVRLTVPMAFMGETKDGIAGEAVTNQAGRAMIRFAPAGSGTVKATVSYWGEPGYAPADTKVTFDVAAPAVTYEPEPVGLQAFWARSWVILLPFLAVWTTYLVVVTLIVRIRRAGTHTPAPTR